MSALFIRRPNFQLEAGAGGLWNSKLPELSHTLNAFQLALPYLEPYFIDAIKQAAEQLEDPQLKADALDFCAQEANHARQHKRYCRLLQQRYPQLAEYEAAIRQSLIDSRQRDPLAWRLAYTSGYEAITAQLARWLFRNAQAWFDGADPHFAALMTWHAAEEIEHRHVAFDVLQAVDPSYALRVKGLLAALYKTYADMTPVVSYMLEVDGYRRRTDSRLRRLQIRLSCAAELTQAAARYLMPGYHPSHDPEPRGFEAWQREHTPSQAPAAIAG
jgi:predicted metal-dependent hydrolase